MTTPQSKSAVAANISQTSEKYQTLTEMAVQKDEQPPLELEPAKLLNFRISDTEGTKSKTLSSLGGIMMQQNLAKEQNQSSDGISPKIESNHHEQQHNNVNALYDLGDHEEESLRMLDTKAVECNKENNMPLLSDIREDECTSGAARFAECLEQKGDFSDDLVNAIKRIESRILAFKLCSKLADSSKNGAVRNPLNKVANSGSPKLQRKDSAARNQLSSKTPILEEHRLMNQHTCNSSSKGENLIPENAVEKPFLARNESLSQSHAVYKKCGLHTNAESAKDVDTLKHINTPMVSREELRNATRVQPSVQNMATMDRVKSLKRLVSGDTNLGNQASECIRGLRVPLNLDDLTKKPSMFSSQTNRESLVRKSSVASWSKPDQNHKGRNSESFHAHKLARSKPSIATREKPLPHQMVIKPTLLDQRSSDIKVNSHQHRDRDWPVLDQRGTHKIGHVEPLKTMVQPQLHEQEESISNSDSSSQWTSQQDSADVGSVSEGSSLSVGTQGSKSGRIVEASYEGSSEESSDSYLNKENGRSHRVGSFKTYGYHSKGNPNKPVGGLKRLKNKLGLIFHHHHHHHHHHHDNDNGRIQSYEGPRNSMWNNVQNVFHHKNKHLIITNQNVKTKRGAITKVMPRGNQVGQFHRLVEGLLRHVRLSKKSKPSMHGHRQKKLHWWQTLRRRKGVKLKNKGRVKKTGFVTQKSLKY